MWFTRIKRFYEQGLWSKAWVWDSVGANKITIEQYKEITGEKYNAEGRPTE